jgi:putative tryptophan/tyrosine transport system substrate-binding protein
MVLATMWLVLDVLGTPVAALAQTPVRVARIGMLLFSTPTTDPGVRVFRDALHELGWIEGRNVTFEYRFADRQADRLADLATDRVVE